MTAKRIVITGASDGIGAAAARQLKAMGHEVVLVGRSEKKTQRLAAELNAPYHLADYFRLSDVVRLAGELAAYDRIDVLCNNAGGALNACGLTEAESLAVSVHGADGEKSAHLVEEAVTGDLNCLGNVYHSVASASHVP